MIIDKENRDVFVSEAIIRPTGLVDPEIEIFPVENQVQDIIGRVRECVERSERVLITTLTKKFAEELDIYFKSLGIKSTYIHSDVDTMKRIDILADLRSGVFNVLIGINLLREGLDLPEVSLVAIFDADKEGFLRSDTSLIQIVGRAARHENGKVVMYADKITDSMKRAIKDNEYKRYIQSKHNELHNITPRSTRRSFQNLKSQAVEKNILQDENPKDTGTNNDGFNFEVESRFKQKGKKGATFKASMKGSSLENNFEIKKNTILHELKTQNLNETDLKEILQIAIDDMNFEKCAAIKDLLQQL